jgi:2-hydroxy-3-keto-5-methylthiopentenyl-1-phosphate phosphatase
MNDEEKRITEISNHVARIEENMKALVEDCKAHDKGISELVAWTNEHEKQAIRDQAEIETTIKNVLEGYFGKRKRIIESIRGWAQFAMYSGLFYFAVKAFQSKP